MIFTHELSKPGKQYLLNFSWDNGNKIYIDSQKFNDIDYAKAAIISLSKTAVLIRYEKFLCSLSKEIHPGHETLERAWKSLDYFLKNDVDFLKDSFKHFAPDLQPLIPPANKALTAEFTEIKEFIEKI